MLRKLLPPPHNEPVFISLNKNLQKVQERTRNHSEKRLHIFAKRDIIYDNIGFLKEISNVTENPKFC